MILNIFTDVSTDDESVVETDIEIYFNQPTVLQPGMYVSCGRCRYKCQENIKQDKREDLHKTFCLFTLNKGRDKL